MITEQLIPNWNEKIESFDQMDLPEGLTHGIYSYGFREPSEIQSLSISPIRDGRNVIAQAQSGTGKTGAFSIGVLSRINLEQRTTQALLLSPTRELAEQTFDVISALGSRLEGLTVALFKGGTSQAQSEREALALPNIAVATPGRALSLIVSGHLRTENIITLVIDEADEMFDQGFQDQMKEIISYLSPNTQMLLFSATMPAHVVQMVSEAIKDPIKIFVREEAIQLRGINQYYINVGESSHKMETLLDIYRSLRIQKAVIFANSQQTVEYLAEQLNEAGFEVSAIHGGMAQDQRDSIIERFRSGASRVLISTDLLGRGFDVHQITLVINFELSRSPEQYTHRVGRAGRYGRKGVAISICDSREVEGIKRIESKYNTKIEESPEDIGAILERADQENAAKDSQEQS